MGSGICLFGFSMALMLVLFLLISMVPFSFSFAGHFFGRKCYGPLAVAGNGGRYQFHVTTGISFLSRYVFDGRVMYDMPISDKHVLVLHKLMFLQAPSEAEAQCAAVCKSGKVCATKGPRPRYPRVWKTKTRIGTVSKSTKLVHCGLSNVKEEVYGALDSFIAWDLEFPLITVKKALKTLENEHEWKRIIQVIKWMLSKGQGRTMGTYFTLLNALAEDGRLDEVDELWTKLFSDNLESMPRIFFNKMISIYYKRDMYDKIFEIFADMEELGIRSNVNLVGNVFQKLGMLDKYNKLKKKYPPPRWEYRYIKGKRVRIRANNIDEFDSDNSRFSDEGEGVGEIPQRSNEFDKEADAHSNEIDYGTSSSPSSVEHDLEFGD